MKYKVKYEGVDNNRRTTLIELVTERGARLKDASLFLGINYSTAKTILRVFRNEKRRFRKYAYKKIKPESQNSPLLKMVSTLEKRKYVESFLLVKLFRVIYEEINLNATILYSLNLLLEKLRVSQLWRMKCT